MPIITEVLLVAVCYAIGPLIASRKLSGLPPVGMTAACLAFAAVVYAPLAALTWTSALPSAKVLAAVAGLAVICTAVAFLLIFRLIAEVHPARASVITYINPAVAVAIGVSVLGERAYRLRDQIDLRLCRWRISCPGSTAAGRRGRCPRRREAWR